MAANIPLIETNVASLGMAARDLRASLYYVPSEASIWFDGRRMVLTDNESLGIMRRELIQSVGYERARAIMTRMGYQIGATDAQLALRVRKDASVLDGFAAGPELHGLKGVVRVEQVKLEIDLARRHFYAEYFWDHSSECEAHLQCVGIGNTPGGWSQIGYAAGYATAFLGRPIIYREVQCIAMGHSRCFLVGKPEEQWAEDEIDLRHFRAQNYRDGAAATADRPKTASPDGEGVPSSNGDAEALVGTSAGFNLALHLLDRVANTKVATLFLGESGVGKEVFARELHRRSQRAAKPFIAVNCAALPETLIEAELFGVERGAFTGAVTSRSGRFERADGGTLFLDEIGTLSLPAQAKLLRVLQDGSFERVGGDRLLTSTARLVAATNVDLAEAVSIGAFRQDLYQRLNVFPIRIPPLRERRADIPLLVDHFLQRFAHKHARQGLHFTAAALRYFLTHDWPGNIRELENLIERAVLLADEGASIDLHHLSTGVIGNSGKNDPVRDFIIRQGWAGSEVGALARNAIDRGIASEAIIDEMIVVALARSGGNISAAAQLVGLSRSQLNYRLGNRPQLRLGGASSGDHTVRN